MAMVYCKKNSLSNNLLNLLGEVQKYNLYYSLTPFFNESFLGLKLVQVHIILCLINFYQINKNDEI
jgi:hypothetical protein